ncbi:hypothetical protein [Pontibacter cellulosilyticus]|uniref:Uncharacterized protein n=1 Tax=Pontibacter cellulosilyticus TaxID=1720253 RepID=A0A923N8C3_9BACT|nr:hypothetical protein [Pontibacter cellulosilyticus]MBC5993271.1 hypothetical protein [Pontibacter cellulosilyticus]
MRKIVALLLLALNTSCSDPKPKVVYDDAQEIAETENQILDDSTSIAVASIPIHFDSTFYLIHPIGQYSPNKRGADIYMSSYESGNSGIAVAYRNNQEISGNFDNVKFQHVDSASFTSLTKRQIKIRSITFLRSIFESTKNQLLLYSLTDKDTNKDRKLDTDDIESLYISSINGHNLQKLSPDLQELVDWQIIDVQKRIYFITSEDIDKNGEFNKNDQLHYFYVDLGGKSFDVVEYYPLERADSEPNPAIANLKQ